MMSGTAGEADTALDAEQALKEWMEPVVFSRKGVSHFRNISRDFSDGYCVAEVIKHYIPKLVEMHNYRQASSTHQKIENWKTLNHKVLSKLDVEVPMGIVQKIVHFRPGVMQMVLNNIKIRIEKHLKPKLDKEDDSAAMAAALRARTKNAAASPDARPRDRDGRGHTGVERGGGGEGGGGGRLAGGAGGRRASVRRDDVDTEMLHRCIGDYEEVNAMLLTKVKKLEALLKLKDKRILVLERKCSENGISP